MARWLCLVLSAMSMRSRQRKKWECRNRQKRLTEGLFDWLRIYIVRSQRLRVDGCIYFCFCYKTNDCFIPNSCFAEINNHFFLACRKTQFSSLWRCPPWPSITFSLPANTRRTTAMPTNITMTLMISVRRRSMQRSRRPHRPQQPPQQRLFGRSSIDAHLVRPSNFTINHSDSAISSTAIKWTTITISSSPSRQPISSRCRRRNYQHNGRALEPPHLRPSASIEMPLSISIDLRIARIMRSHALLTTRKRMRSSCHGAMHVSCSCDELDRPRKTIDQ